MIRYVQCPDLDTSVTSTTTLTTTTGSEEFFASFCCKEEPEDIELQDNLEWKKKEERYADKNFRSKLRSMVIAKPLITKVKRFKQKLRYNEK
jgi:hypothetical protein